MRNFDFEIDQEIFRFINSEYCSSYNVLLNYVRKRNLPLNERWVFYLLGKLNYINDQVIEGMSVKSYRTYGGVLFPEVKHWRRYLEGEFEERKRIQEGLNAGTPYDESVSYQYYAEGWEFVRDEMEYDVDRDTDEWIERDEYGLDLNEDDEYCDACQNSPCMCSDQEKTSTKIDF